MIPKILHQTWKDYDVPIEWHEVISRSRALHPDWEYQLWSDFDIQEFVVKEFPQLVAIFNRYPMNIMRADVVRYCILSRIGGLYFDLDYEFLKPFDLGHHGLVLPQSRDGSGRCQPRIGNCVMASKPNHPFWNEVFAELHQNTQGFDVRSIDVEELTGPGMLTRVMARVKGEYAVTCNESDLAGGRAGQAEILSLPRRYFHPPIPRSNRERQDLVAEGTAYGIHYCGGTWRPIEPLWRRTIRRLIPKSVRRWRPSN